MNEGQIRRKVFFRLLGHPVVIAPFVLGVTGWTAVWALGLATGLGWFAACAGILGSAGAYVTRLLLDESRTARAVLEEDEMKEQQARQAALDELDRRLVTCDDDPRPEIALRDLRALVRAFDEFADKTDSLHSPAVIEVRSRVQRLFDYSVHSLEQTLELGDTARILHLPEARKPLLEQRERIIADIQAGIKQVGATLAALQRIGAGDASDRELGRLRVELDQSLEIAGRVEARLNSLLDQTEPDIRSQTPPSRAANHQKGH